MAECFKNFREFKNLLLDIFNTRYYQQLKMKYVPKKFKRISEKDGIVRSVGQSIQFDIPDKESMAYALSLLRQFLLRRYKPNIHSIGRCIKEISLEVGDEKFIEFYEDSYERFKNWKNQPSGANYTLKDENGAIIRDVSFKKFELVNELLYGDIYHRNIEDRIPVDDIMAMNKITQYFLDITCYICQIANCINKLELKAKKIDNSDFEDFSQDIHNKCAEKILGNR
ncbi:MAG: hypothetical protein ACFFCS_03040 [Candidatus Hodarchaeota archaeon]